MSQLETVKVKSADGYVIINKDDFDKEVHTLYKEKAKKEKVSGLTKVETKEGSNWYNVFDAEGNQVNEGALREKEADELIASK